MKESPKQTPLQLYASLAHLRQDRVFQRGEILFGKTDDNVLSYVRQIPGSDAARYCVIMNLGQKAAKADVSGSPVGSTNGLVTHFTCSLEGKVKGGDEVNLTDLELQPGDGLVVKVL